MKRLLTVPAVVAIWLVVLLAGLLLSASTTAGAAPTSAPSSQPSDANGAQKFYGTVTAVDVNAKTFVVDNQTYTVVPETHMTKAADDSEATLADAVVGQPARGTYTRSADGRLNVTKVRFGRKSGGSGKSGGKKAKNGGAGGEGGAATKPAHSENQ